MTAVEEQVDRLAARVAELEAALPRVCQLAPGKEWYSPAEAARLLGRAEWTVREWCRLGRVHAAKRAGGRGRHRAWAISGRELLRVSNEGLLPAG